jgi:hypothetical protein
MGRTATSFGTLARQQQARFRSCLSAAAQRPDDDKGLRNPHLIAHGCELENLYPSLRGAGGAIDFFRDRRIKWWTSARSGDRPMGPEYEGPTRNLASSQVACVNFLLPLAAVPDGLTTFLRAIDEDVLGVVTITDREGKTSPVEFEWVGWSEPLEGGAITRGANQTSVDALVIGRIAAGNRAYLFEWKYCEEYRHPEDKGLGSKGETRRRRYQDLFKRSDSSFNNAAPFGEFLFEPFYQIMRLHLLADRMLREGVGPDLPICDARVVVVCPDANQQYRETVRTTPLSRRFPTLTTVEDAVRATLKVPRSFSVVAPEIVLRTMRASQVSPSLAAWTEYHRQRYGW